MVGTLDDMCKTHGPDSPIGSRASMLSQQIQNLPPGPDERIEYLTSDSAKRQREALVAAITKNQVEIEQIIRDGGTYIPEHHISNGAGLMVPE